MSWTVLLTSFQNAARNNSGNRSSVSTTAAITILMMMAERCRRMSAENVDWLGNVRQAIATIIGIEWPGLSPKARVPNVVNDLAVCQERCDTTWSEGVAWRP